LIRSSLSSCPVPDINPTLLRLFSGFTLALSWHRIPTVSRSYFDIIRGVGAKRVTESSKAIGQRVRQAREDAGLTQTQLAKMIGSSSRQVIGEVERGDPISKVKLGRIAKATGKSPGWFEGQPGLPNHVDDPRIAEMIELTSATMERFFKALADRIIWELDQKLKKPTG